MYRYIQVYLCVSKCIQIFLNVVNSFYVVLGVIRYINEYLPQIYVWYGTVSKHKGM